MKAGGGHGLSRSKDTASLCNTEPVTRNSSRRFGAPLVGVCIQCLICIISLTLGLRMSQQALYLVTYFREPGYYPPLFRRTLPTFEDAVGSGGTHDTASLSIGKQINGTNSTGSLPVLNVSQVEGAFDLPTTTSIKSGVSVGRHKILIRPWPHPDPNEMMLGYSLLRRVQLEQDRLHGVKDRRPIIAITPTFVRTFQAVHLTGLVHSLSLVLAPVTWIVIEAGGMTNETAFLLEQAPIQKLIHIGFDKDMPDVPEERAVVEARMRVEGLRYVREQRLDGIVMFVDESNSHSLQLFDEVQKVQWVGAFSVGMLTHARSASETVDNSEQQNQLSEMDEHTTMQTSESKMTHGHRMQIQGPVCDKTGNFIVGWHTQEDVKDFSIEAARKKRLEWAGFTLNARAVWDDGIDRPPWVHNWDGWVNGDGLVDIRDIVRNESWVEPLGSCGKKVLIWWAQMEAHVDDKHPAKWVVDPQLPIVVPAKRTPWVARPIKPPSIPVMNPPPLVKEESSTPVVIADAGMPLGKEMVLPRMGKPQGSLKSTGRTAKPKQRRRRREGRGNDKRRDLGVT